MGEGTKRNRGKNAGYNMGKRASWTREQTKFEDILATMKKKKSGWAGHVMRRTDNRLIAVESKIHSGTLIEKCIKKRSITEEKNAKSYGDLGVGSGSR